MSDAYMIQVDVMPEFALAAYNRGLADLDAAWPRLMEIAQAKDAEHAAQEQKINEFREEVAKRWKEERIAEREEQRAAKQRLADWQRSNSFFRGPKPVVPWFLPEFSPPFHALRSVRQSWVSRYEELRGGLKSKRNLAAAAAGPFKMSETDVDQMTRWGNGEMVEFLLAIAGELP